jgi:hypothetical protein
MSFCNFTSDKNYEDDEDLVIDDSISSDYYEGFRTNSSSSIKWSIDARNQNEDDWLSIERILYGEEKLPEGIAWHYKLLIFVTYVVSFFTPSPLSSYTQMRKQEKSFCYG